MIKSREEIEREAAAAKAKAELEAEEAAEIPSVVVAEPLLELLLITLKWARWVRVTPTCSKH